MGLLPRLEQIDRRVVSQAEMFDSGVRGYLEYALESQGKRIRPALCLLAAEASGGIREEHLDLGMVVELVHLASLVHDDIMDHALIRRAKPTPNAKWGPELAVLLGDCLFAHALKLCTKFDDNTVSRSIADASNEVCVGEIIQTQRRFDLSFPMQDYYRTIEMKTAALFRVSCELAAFLNKAPHAWVDGLRNFGRELGVAYQIYDDCVDLFGSEEQIGKTLGTDLAKGKLTLPVLHTIRQVEGREMEEFSGLILSKDKGAGEAGDDHQRVIQMVVDHGGHHFAARKAQDHLEKARKSLAVLDDSPARGQMQDLCSAFHRHIGSLSSGG